MKYIALIMMVISNLLAIDDESRPNPYLLTAESQLRETDAKLEEFQLQLDWFVDHIRYYSKEEAQQYEVARTRLLALKKLRAQFQKTQDAFLIFRNELRECHGCMPGTTGMNELLLYSQATMDATNWYIDYMRAAFFPYEWEKLYEKSKGL